MQNLRGYRAAAGALLRPPGGAGLDRQEHLPDSTSRAGSWFFLGELLVSLEIAPDAPPPDRCGTCRRCIDACPTAAIVPGRRRAIPSIRGCAFRTSPSSSGARSPEEQRGAIGRHVFGCDICQDVCPWNRRSPVTEDPAFAPRHFAPPLEEMARLSENGISRDVSRNTVDACAVPRISAECGDRHGQRGSETISRAARETGGIGRPGGGGTCPMGASAMRVGTWPRSRLSYFEFSPTSRAASAASMVTTSTNPAHPYNTGSNFPDGTLRLKSATFRVPAR